MGRYRRLFFWALAGALGCSDGATFFMPPDIAGFEVVLVVVHDVEPPRGFAIELDDPNWRVRLDLDLDDAAAIDLLAYNCSLSSLGLEPGQLRLVGVGGRPLVSPDRVWSSSGEQRSLAWAVRASVPPRVAGLRVLGEAADLCAVITVDEVQIEGESADPHALVQDGPGRVLVGLDNGRQFHLHVASRQITPAYVGSRSSRGLWMTSTLGADGPLLFSTGIGCLGRVEGDTIRELACLPSTTTASSGTWIHIDADDVSGPDVTVGILLDGGEMFRYTNGAFERIELVGTVGVNDKGGVHVQSKDDLLFAGPFQQQIVRYDGRVARPELLPLGAFDKITGVTDFGDGVGPLGVTNNGALLTFDDDVGWRLFADAALPQARRVTRVGDRFFVGGEGPIVEVLTDGTVCPVQVNIGTDVRRMIALDAQLIIAADAPENRDGVRIFILTLDTPGPLCR